MLFIVPDGDPTEEEKNTGANPPAGETPAGGSPGESSEDGKGANSGSSEGEAKFKVELDLDDAPFLEEEMVEEAKPETPSPAEEKEEIEEEKKESFIKRLLSNKKKLIIVGGGALFLIIIIVVVLFLFMGGDDGASEKATETVEAVEAVEEVQEEPKEEVPPPEPIIFKVQNGTGDDNPTILPYQFLINWEPFLVPLKGSEGEIRLLQCTIAIPVDDESLHSELEKKKSALRDAVFYYLSHRPFGLLDTPKAQADFKRDIISVINERVLSAKIQDILIEDYLVQGP